MSKFKDDRTIFRLECSTLASFFWDNYRFPTKERMKAECSSYVKTNLGEEIRGWKLVIFLES